MVAAFHFVNPSTDIKVLTASRRLPLANFAAIRLQIHSPSLVSSPSLFFGMSMNLRTGGISGIPDIVANFLTCCMMEVMWDSCAESFLASIVRVQKEKV